MSRYSIMICGNIGECRTEAEITRDSDHGREVFVALVHESAEGWHEEIFDQPAGDDEARQLAAALARARESLVQYVNRRGDNPPEGLTAAGLSFWLMEMSDGTAMGRPVPD